MRHHAVRAVTLLAVMFALALPAAAAARTTLHVALATPPRIVHIDVDRGVVTGTTPLACPPSSLVTVGNGAFLVWSDDCGDYPTAHSRLNVLHVASGGMTVIPGVGGQLLAHPAAAQLFAAGLDSVFITVGAGGVVSENMPCRFYQLAALSGDGQSRAHSCTNGPIMQLTWEVIVESGAGGRYRQFPGAIDAAALDVHASTLFSAPPTSAGPTAILRKFDVESGRETLRTSYDVVAPGYPKVFVDPRTSRVFVLRPEQLLAFAPESLALSGATTIGGDPGSLVFDPSSTNAYVSSLDHGQGRLSVVDTAAMTVTLSVVTPDPIVSVALVSPPAPPMDITSSVTGGTVNIGWVLPVTGPAATGYVVEAGTAPGLANLASVETVEPSLTAAGVPSGIYYVRVRARNDAGTSSPSAEVAITVP